MKRFYVVLCASLVCALNVQAQLVPTANTDVDCDGSVQITATPAANYHFVQWNDGNTDNPRTITNVKAVATYVATFAADETDMGQDIVAEDENGNPIAWPVTHGTTIYLSVDVDDCHTFHWSDITDPTHPDYSANPRAFEYYGVAPEFTAVLTLIQYNVTVNTATGDATQGGVSITTIP